MRVAREAQFCAVRDDGVRLLAEKHSAVSEWDCFLQPKITASDNCVWLPPGKQNALSE